MDDDEDFVFYGTPIEREDEIGSRKKKAIAEASGQLRTLPAWKQEVRDEEGRRRFHGAFTGGFSAGYFNTVGTKEGWTPQTFVSSRKSRAEVKQQNILNFLDEDERADMVGQSLGTSSQFDTFGFTAQDLARKQAEKEQKERPSAIPGPAPDDIVLPATDSIGVKLLLKMGWRRGRTIKDSHADSVADARREARKAFLAFSSGSAKAQTPEFESVSDEPGNNIEQSASDVQSSQRAQVFVLSPKQDVYGLGFDPYKNAPEFRDRKRLHESGKRDPEHRKSNLTRGNLFGFKSGKVAPGFGIGALEDLDAEDADVFASEYDFEETYVQEIDEPSTNVTVDINQKFITNEQGVLPGFRLASNAEYKPERYDPPIVPKDFVPHHKFPRPLEADFKVSNVGPPEVNPPEDNNLKLLIDGVATLVARCGKLFEDLSRDKNQENPMFSFLLGGNGHDYYARKLWEARQKRVDQIKPESDVKASLRVEKLTAESRGNILGERPLERSSKVSSSPVIASDSIQLKYNLTDTFMKPVPFNKVPEAAKPFKDDPAKQERFEQFLKQKYEGGLRTVGFAGASYMSEEARASERLDFEAAADAIEKGNWGKEINSSTQVTDLLGSGGLQFTTGGLQKANETQAEDLTMTKPKREEFQWRPAPILCKRFDLIDPYMGKPPPPPRIRSKIDTLIFTADSVKAKSIDEAGTRNSVSFAKPWPDTKGGLNTGVAESEVEHNVQVENVERPVDLYKAIFSDDSDEEEDTTASNLNKEHPEKKAEAANTALSRLMAGDFLESLGKELGLEVPPDPPYSSNNPVLNSANKEIIDVKSVNHNRTTVTIDEDKIQMERSRQTSREIESNRVNSESSKIRTKHRRSSSVDSSSEDEKNKRHSRSRRQKHRGSGSDSDSSSDDRERHHHRSRSKRRKHNSSSREKSRSDRKKRDKRKASPSRSRYGIEKDHSNSRRDKHLRREVE